MRLPTLSTSPPKSAPLLYRRDSPSNTCPRRAMATQVADRWCATQRMFSHAAAALAEAASPMQDAHIVNAAHRCHSPDPPDLTFAAHNQYADQGRLIISGTQHTARACVRLRQLAWCIPLSDPLGDVSVSWAMPRYAMTSRCILSATKNGVTRSIRLSARHRHNLSSPLTAITPTSLISPQATMSDFLGLSMAFLNFGIQRLVGYIRAHMYVVETGTNSPVQPTVQSSPFHRSTVFRPHSRSVDTSASSFLFTPRQSCISSIYTTPSSLWIRLGSRTTYTYTTARARQVGHALRQRLRLYLPHTRRRLAHPCVVMHAHSRRPPM